MQLCINLIVYVIIFYLLYLSYQYDGIGQIILAHVAGLIVYIR